MKNLMYKPSFNFFRNLERGLCLILNGDTLKYLSVSAEEVRYTTMLLYELYTEY